MSVLNSPDATRDRVTEKGQGGQETVRETKGSEKKERKISTKESKERINGNGEEDKGIKERINEFYYNKNTQGLFTSIGWHKE